MIFHHITHRSQNRINRNIVECKFFIPSRAILPVHRINRNIVECKSSVKNDMGYKICGINRNIVECK